MLGGYGVFGAGATAETSVSGIPEHSFLHIKFKFYSIDSWDTEVYYFEVDGVTVVEKAQVYWNGVDVCGIGGWDERFNEHDLIVPHTADSVTFRFSSTLNEDAWNEAWGISDFVAEYYTDDASCSWDFDAVPTIASLYGDFECLVRCEFGQD